jgi:hypothetical protein
MTKVLLLRRVRRHLNLVFYCQIYFLSSTLDPKDVEMAKGLPFSKGFLRKPLSKELLETMFRTDPEN